MKSLMEEPRADNRHLEPRYFFGIDLVFCLLIVANALLFLVPAWHRIPVPILVDKYGTSLQKFGFSSESIEAILRSINAALLIDCVFFAVRLDTELRYRETKLSANNFIYAYIAFSIILALYFIMIGFTNGNSIYELSVGRPMSVNIFIIGMVGHALAGCIEKAIAQQLAFYK